MIFQSPSWLLALVLLPLAAGLEIWLARRDRDRLARLVARPLWGRVVRRPAERWRLLRLALALLGAACVVVALARPQWGIVREKVEREGVDVVLVLDTSASMAAADVAPSRFFLARQALLQLVSRLEGDRFALVAFEGEAYPLVPLTLDADALGLFLETVEPGIVPAPGTSLGVGLARGLDAFVDKERRNKVMVLVSDGEDLEGEIEAALGRAKEAGVVVHAVGIGTETGQPVPEQDAEGRVTGYKRDAEGQAVVSRLELQNLEAVARGTGGQLFRITPQDTSLSRLASAIEGMEQKSLMREYSYRRKERFQIPLALGLACLASALLLPLPRPRRRAAAGANPRPARVAAAAVAFLLSCASAGAQSLPASPAPSESASAAMGRSEGGSFWDEILLRPRRETAKGRGQYASGNHPEALAAFERAAAARPRDPALRFNVADGLYKKGRYDEAATLFRSLGGDPKAPLAAPSRFNLGNSLYQKQDYRGAIQAYRDALRLAPGEADTRRNLELALRALKEQQEQQQRDQQKQNQNQQKQDQQDKDQQQQQQNRKQQDQQQGAAATGRAATEAADEAGARRPALPAGGGDAAAARDAAARRSAAEREGGAEEAARSQARTEEERQGLVSRGVVACARFVIRASAAAAALLLVAQVAAAFTVRSEVDARKLGVRDRVQLTITIEGSDAPEQVPLPALTNLQLVGGPFQSTQVSIVNGRMSQSRSFSYVLQPQAVGKAEVGMLRAGDQSAPAIPIEVVAGSIREAEPQRSDPFGADPFEELFGRRRARGRAVEPKVLVEARVSRTRLRVGEPLVLTYFLDTQASIGDLQPKDAPQYAGFWTEDLERPQTGPSGEGVTIGGESYRRFPLIRKLLFPTKAGTLTLPAASFRIGIASQGFFDTGGVVERATQPVTITVDPLPDAPGFSGAVGRFTTSAALDRELVPLGEAATLRFRVQGTGNLKWIDKGPEVTASGAKVYPPQTKSELRTTAEGITGSRTWEFVVVPETSGLVEIPALVFSWFDPKAGAIVTTQTKPLALRVEGGTASLGLPAPPATAAARSANGMLPLRSGLDARAAIPALSGRTLGLLVGLGLLLHAGLWGADRLRAVVRRGEGRRASARSVRSAMRDLERAGQTGLSKERAAALIEKALHEAFGEVAEQDESERARAVRAILDEVHFVRYAPQLGDYSDKIRTLAARGADVVRSWA